MDAARRKEENELRLAGYSHEEILEDRANISGELLAAGYSKKEVDDYFGVKEPNMTPIKDLIQENLKKFNENVAAAQPVRTDVPVDKNSSGTTIKKADSFLSAIEAGFDMSVTGLIAQRESPDTILPENAPMAYRIASQAATIAGDVPAMVAGYLIGAPAGSAVGATYGTVLGPAGTAAGAIGGSVVGGGAMANALPEALRGTLMSAYEEGGIQDFGDFWERSSSILIDTAKAGTVGALTDAVGGGVGLKLAKSAVGTRALSIAASEVATATTVGAALEGHVPNAKEFVDGAVLVAGLTASAKIAGKLRKAYTKTGMRPAELATEIDSNPVLMGELASENIELPKALGGEPGQLQKLSSDLVETPDFVGEQGGVAAYELKPSVEQPQPILPEVVRTPEETRILSKIAEEKSSPLFPHTLSEMSDKAYTDVVDHLYPVKRAQDELSGGKKLRPSEDPYLLLRLTAGDYGRVQTFLHDGPREFGTYKKVGRGLSQILEPVRLDPDGFNAFALSMRTIELDKRGIKTGIDLADAQAAVAKGKKTYEPIFRELVEYQNHLTAYLRDAGMLTKDQYDQIIENNKDYIPLRRALDESGKGGKRGGKTLFNPIKAIKGSEREILNPIQTVVENTNLAITLAERNRALSALAKLAEENPDIGGELFKRVPIEREAINVRGDETSRALKEQGIDADGVEDFTVFRGKKQALSESEVVVYRNGKREVWEAPKDLAKALRGVDQDTLGLGFRIAAGFTNVLKTGVVLAPDFMLRNTIRDQATAFITSDGAYTPYHTALGLKDILGKSSDDYHNWYMGGGAQSAWLELNKTYIDSEIFKNSKQTGLIGKTWNVAKSRVQVLDVLSRVEKNPLEWLRKGGENVENATRLGEFKRATKGQTDIDSILEGSFRAREITLDFAKHGAKTKALRSLVAFVNPGILGLDKTARSFKDRPLETLAKVGLTVTPISVLLWWANKDDPRYQEVEQWQKDTYWIIPTDKWEEATPEQFANVPDYLRRQNEDGTLEINNGPTFRIPKPQELGVFFGSFPERILEKYVANNPRAMKDLDQTILNIIPGGMPAFALAPMEHFFNKSVFTGAPIIPSHLEGLMPEYQYKEYTSETAKQLGKIISAIPGQRHRSGGLAAPVVIEHYLTSWTSTMGRYALELSDKGLRKAGVVPEKVNEPLKTLADTPVFKAFVVRNPSARTKSIRDFRETFDEMQTVSKTLRHLAKTGNFEALETEMVRPENQDRLVNLIGIKNALDEHSQVAQNIRNNPEMTPEEKRQLEDGVYYNMINLARMGLQVADEYRESLKAQK